VKGETDLLHTSHFTLHPSLFKLYSRMLSESDRSFSEAFVDVARDRGLLSEERAREIVELSKQRKVPPSQVAIEMEWLQPVDVEIVHAFIAPDDLAPGYELLDVVGTGALGVVYRARQPHLQRDVAIKAILQSRLSNQNVAARFQQEGAAIGRLQHPNIVSAYDFGSHRNRLYLVMEFVPGVDLARRLDEGAFLTDISLSIIRQAAAGLAHAWSQGVIHRDIKPANLLLTDAPAGYELPAGVPLVKIADFGLARFHRSPEIDEQETRLTIEGAALGTPMYCAPEQLSGDEVDHRADIYALGATLFRLLAGHPPFPPDKVSRIIAAKVTGQPPRVELLPSDLAPEVRQLLLDMMKADPEDRIGDYGELLNRIDAVGSGKRALEVRRAGTPATSTRAGWPPWVKRLGAALALALIFAVGALLQRHWQQPAVPTMTPSGYQSHLFDGRTMNGWIVRGGLWKSGVDSEGGAVLVGRGSAVRQLPIAATTGLSPDNGLGVRIGVDLQDARAAEVHFAFQGENRESSPRLVIELSQVGVVFGAKKNDGSELVAAGPVVEMPANPSDQPRYHEVRLERHGSHWFASFDDVILGSRRADENEDVSVIKLIADGTVHFEGPLVYRLSPSTADGGEG
jgi:serine/threonine protein kinase